jgi:hypothetical protein
METESIAVEWGGGGYNNIIKMTRKEKDLYRFELV